MNEQTLKLRAFENYRMNITHIRGKWYYFVSFWIGDIFYETGGASATLDETIEAAQDFRAEALSHAALD